MEVEVGIVSNKECGEKYGEPTSDLFLCAASPGKDSCQVSNILFNYFLIFQWLFKIHSKIINKGW